jgi:flagellar hook protein FlgE
MGILSSMYTGLTGIQGQGEAISVFGDNIANSATTGFKTSRPEFKDQVAASLNGAQTSAASGRGSRVFNVHTLFSQGTLTQTESPTDLAITGNGFFTVEGQDGRSYSRDGAFHFDKEGRLVNGDGDRVMGFLADENGKITTKLGPMAIDRAVLDAKGTDSVKINANLDSRSDTSVKFDANKPESTSHFATGLTVYDTNGAPRGVTVYFNKTEGNSWEWRAMARGEDVEGGKAGSMVVQASGSLQFDDKGRLLEQKTDKSSFNFNKGSKGDQKIDFAFGKDIKSGGDGLSFTQYGATSEAYRTTQNGFTSGTIGSVKFEGDGSLVAYYTNGEMIKVAQVALAKFESPDELMKAGGNKWKETRDSGQPTIGSPLSGGRGKVSSKALEASTTDIANEFINLMTAQRNFQANSKVISVGDELLGEIINLKRT